MQNSVYEQFEANFESAYGSKIKPCVENRAVYFKRNRLKQFIALISFAIFWLSFCAAIYWIGLYASFVNNLFHIHIINIQNTPAPGILLAAAMISGVIMLFCGLTLKDPYPKKDAMRDLLDIFSTEALWDRGCLTAKNEKLEYYKKSNIFNKFPYAIIDDSMHMDFEGVTVDIYEVNTKLVNFASVFMFTFISCFGCFLLGVVYIAICLLIFVLTPFIFFIHAPFVGVVVELKMNKNFEGHTFFLNKSFNSLKIPVNRKMYQTVNLESVEFSGKYKTYSTDQVEARYLLTTAMIDRLKNLGFAFKANYIRGSFKDDKLILAIDTQKDMFRIGDTTCPMDYNLFRESFDEVVSVLKIVDQLKLNIKTGL